MPYIYAMSIVKETLAQNEMQQLLRNTTAEERQGLAYWEIHILEAFSIVGLGICISNHTYRPVLNNSSWNLYWNSNSKRIHTDLKLMEVTYA